MRKGIRSLRVRLLLCCALVSAAFLAAGPPSPAFAIAPITEARVFCDEWGPNGFTSLASEYATGPVRIAVWGYDLEVSSVGYRLDGGEAQTSTRTVVGPNPPPSSPAVRAASGGKIGPPLPVYEKALVLSNHSGVDPGAGPAFCLPCHDMYDHVASNYEICVTPGILGVYRPAPAEYQPHATQTCENCHGFPETIRVIAEVLVSTPGPHTIEYWAKGFQDPSGSKTFRIGSAGPGPRACEPLTISASASVVRRDFSLSGGTATAAMAGRNLVVVVRKPGKTYWSYSSRRRMYLENGSARWWYRYRVTPRVRRGIYAFRAIFEGDESYLRRGTRIASVRVR